MTLALLHRLCQSIHLPMHLSVTCQVMYLQPRKTATPKMKRKPTLTHGTGDRSTNRKYCTQNCLLGLKHGRALDQSCPNYRSHRPAASHSHPIFMALFHRLVQSQLTADMDRNCEPLGKQGVHSFESIVSFLQVFISYVK
jgi:hypothetical protein